MAHFCLRHIIGLLIRIYAYNQATYWVIPLNSLSKVIHFISKYPLDVRKDETEYVLLETEVLWEIHPSKKTSVSHILCDGVKTKNHAPLIFTYATFI